MANNAMMEEFRNSLYGMTHDELVDAAVAQFREKVEALAKLAEFQRASTEMSIQFQQMKDEAKGLRGQVEELLKQNRHLTDQRILQTRDLFGRSTERTADVLDRALHGEAEGDPLGEDSDGGADAGALADGGGNAERAGAAGGRKDAGKRNGKKEKGKRARDLSGMPLATAYVFNVAEYNALYGEGNWSIAFWNVSRTVEVVRATSYVLATYRPVIAVGLGHELVAVPNETSLLQRSIVSPSLMAMIYADRYQMFLPLYRAEKNQSRLGFALSRQTMSNWCVRFAGDLLSLPYNYMKEELRTRTYQQCDETTWRVIRDERGAGATSFVWVHRTGELDAGPAIVVYCFEKTRAAEHLAEFFRGVTWKVFLTCDAYAAYETLASLFGGQIVICGCFMHVRRRFVDALNVLPGLKGMDREKLDELPEVKALDLLRDLYVADAEVKNLPPEERNAGREGRVSEAAEKFFEFVHGFDVDAAGVSERMRDAIQYARNQEDSLRRFLDDGSIPIDNGAAERAVRPIAQSRVNSLFSCTEAGARASMIVASIEKTAELNGADPYYYFKYLLERLPGHLADKDRSYLAEMMPWSEQYKAYEREERRKIISSFAPASQEKPRTPKKKKSLRASA